MKVIMRAVCIMSIIYLTACATQSPKFRGGMVLLEPQGELIKLQTKLKHVVTGEFLFSDHEAIYVLASAKADQDIFSVHSFHHQEIEFIQVISVINKKWPGYVVGLQLVPALLLGVAALAADTEVEYAVQISLLFSIPGLLTSAAYAGSTPQAPQLKAPISKSSISPFLKYARYPYFPNPEQKEKILEQAKLWRQQRMNKSDSGFGKFGKIWDRP